MDVEGPGDIADRLTFFNEVSRQGALVGPQFGRAAEGNASCLGGPASFLGSRRTRGAASPRVLGTALRARTPPALEGAPSAPGGSHAAGGNEAARGGGVRRRRWRARRWRRSRATRRVTRTLVLVAVATGAFAVLPSSTMQPRGRSTSASSSSSRQSDPTGSSSTFRNTQGSIVSRSPGDGEPDSGLLEHPRRPPRER